MQYLEVQPQDEMPSLILLDLNMPGKDGRESLRDIKNNKRFHHIPTVVFTTSSSYRDKQAVYDLGANCFVTKPDTFNQLTELTASISRLWLQ
jgi:CheY-like chemotaxis protein